jgi:hypothetical protein
MWRKRKDIKDVTVKDETPGQSAERRKIESDCPLRHCTILPQDNPDA